MELRVPAPQAPCIPMSPREGSIESRWQAHKRRLQDVQSWRRTRSTAESILKEAEAFVDEVRGELALSVSGRQRLAAMDAHMEEVATDISTSKAALELQRKLDQGRQAVERLHQHCKRRGARTLAQQEWIGLQQLVDELCQQPRHKDIDTFVASVPKELPEMVPDEGSAADAFVAEAAAAAAKGKDGNKENKDSSSSSSSGGGKGGGGTAKNKAAATVVPDFITTKENKKEQTNLQDAFAQYRQRRAVAKKKNKAEMRDPANMQKLREKFVETALKYQGTPYAAKYHGPDSEHYQAPLYLDCCGLVRRVMDDLKDDFGFNIGRWNQAYMFDTLPISRDLSEMKPGDLVFYEATYYKDSMRKQKHDMVHVEIFYGGDTGEATIGARFYKQVVKIFDSYKFKSKTYYDIKWHFRSIDTWLMGECKSHCPEHKWVLRAPANAKKSIFYEGAQHGDDDDDDDDMAGETGAAADDGDDDNDNEEEGHHDNNNKSNNNNNKDDDDDDHGTIEDGLAVAPDGDMMDDQDMDAASDADDDLNASMNAPLDDC